MGDIPDVSVLRRFLRTFIWIRGYFPNEVQVVLPYLNAALKHDDVFPLNGERLRAKRAIQELACRCFRLAATDMVGIVSGDRPLEQVADFCPYGWGGTVYQMSSDGSRLTVRGMYGGSLTLSQSNYTRNARRE